MVAALAIVAATALFVAARDGGYIGQVGQHIDGAALLSWFACAGANTFGAVAIVVLLSTVLGFPLGLLAGGRSATGLPRWLELAGALPAFVLTALWVASSRTAPLLVLSLGVGVQRAFQIAGLLSRAERSNLRYVGSLQPVDPDVARLARWQPFLWVAASHSVAVFWAEHAALLLLGLAEPIPNTWVATLCAAAIGAADVSPVAITFATLGVVILPWALWARAGSANT